MKNETQEPLGPDGLPGHDYFLDAVNHIDEAVANNTIAAGAAKGIIFSLVETLGVMVGDPDLPNHLKSGYMGALDLAVELAVEQYDNAGQVCLSGTRILVHESIADAFAEKFKEKAAG